MLKSVRLNEDILRRLENRSNEIGISPDKIANDLLDKALPKESEEMICLADKFDMLVNTGEFDEPTNAIEIRDMIRERKI